MSQTLGKVVARERRGFVLCVAARTSTRAPSELLFLTPSLSRGFDNTNAMIDGDAQMHSTLDKEMLLRYAARQLIDDAERNANQFFFRFPGANFFKQNCNLLFVLFDL